MKRSSTVVLLAFLAFSLHAQVPVMQNVSSRHTVSLDGEWSAIVDPYNHGGNCGFYLDVPFDGTVLSDYDFDTSPKLTVPGDWNTQRPELMLYEGRVWYRTKFRCQPQQSKRLFVHFDAANYESQVWLNGEWLGTHEGGFTPFEFEVTDKVRRGDNSLVVCVDNTRKPQGIPTMNTDWYNYGGITRSVSLVEVPQRYIMDYCVKLSSQKPDIIDGYVQLSDSTAGETVLLEIPELNVREQLTTLSEGQAYIYVNASPELWSPQHPKLYDVKITYNGETVKDRIGFREIRTRGDKILLNGKEVFLRGVNMHEESLSGADGTSRRCTSRQQDSTLLAMAKELGCNFVRLAHYPHNEDMVRLADEMGLMVWSEIPLYWGIDWTSERTYSLAEQQLEEMISRDRNRASVIIWSIANETAVNGERTAFLTRLADKARRLDDSRLITAALQNVNKRLAPNVYTVEDPLKDALDIFSFNEYIGWYDAPKEYCDSITWRLDTDKPVVISEFGGGGRHFAQAASGNGDNAVVRAVKSNPQAYFNEENQADLYRHQFNMLRRIPGLAGTIPWVLKDFRSPHRLLEGVQDGYNRKGLYTDKGEKKPAWEVVRRWNEEHMENLPDTSHAASATYSNPVMRRDCPDPTVLDDRSRTGYFYAYSTQSPLSGLVRKDNTSTQPGDSIINLPVYRSRDLVNWELVGDGFSKGRPAWLKGSKIWAPDINYIDGHYVLYYALGIWANLTDTGSGVAVSDSPTGPFEDKGMVVNFKTMTTANSIDPVFFEDNGHRYLFWGSFGPLGGIWMVELSPDGLSVMPGAKKHHVGAENMEGAFVYKRGEWYYLFASKGTCCAEEKSTYHMVVGRSKSIEGPYLSPDGRKMTSLYYRSTIMQAPDDRTFIGTGHDSKIITDDAGQDWMFYHTYWTGSDYKGRYLNLDPVRWTEDGWPYFEGGVPSTTCKAPVFR